MIKDHDENVAKNPKLVKFLLSIDDGVKDEVITYNQLMDHLYKDAQTDIKWKFKRITSHQGPLNHNDHDYKGSKYNLMIEWENGELTSEPLHIIAADDPVSCAIYGRENRLLDKPGWKRFKTLARCQLVFKTNITKAKVYHGTKYKYGYEVPRNHTQAKEIDARNKNTLWQDATNLELNEINGHNTFIDKGHHTQATIPAGYKKIRVHLVFDVKHDGRHKSRLVADGHLTDLPDASVYSGVVSLRGFRIIVFLAELYGLKLWATNISNAYLEAYTSEKVYIIAGPEFGEK